MFGICLVFWKDLCNGNFAISLKPVVYRVKLGENLMVGDGQLCSMGSSLV